MKVKNNCNAQEKKKRRYIARRKTRFRKFAGADKDGMMRFVLLCFVRLVCVFKANDDSLCLCEHTANMEWVSSTYNGVHFSQDIKNGSNYFE